MHPSCEGGMVWLKIRCQLILNNPCFLLSQASWSSPLFFFDILCQVWAVVRHRSVVSLCSVKKSPFVITGDKWEEQTTKKQRKREYCNIPSRLAMLGRLCTVAIWKLGKLRRINCFHLWSYSLVSAL